MKIIPAMLYVRRRFQSTKSVCSKQACWFSPCSAISSGYSRRKAGVTEAGSGQELTMILARVVGDEGRDARGNVHVTSGDCACPAWLVRFREIAATTT